MAGINQVGYQAMRRLLALGMLNVALFAQARTQQSMGNHGGKIPHTPSAPGEPPEVQTGNLRRSIHAVGYLDGQRVGGDGADGNGSPVPDYAGEIPAGIGAIVGTNTGYGLFVEIGTSRMSARPSLAPAAAEAQSRADELIAAVARRA
jgi:hypothetical protein